MLPEQRHIFESMAVSNKFDNEGLDEQVSLWNVWYLTPRVFEKEAEDRALSNIPMENKENVARTAEKPKHNVEQQNPPKKVEKDALTDDKPKQNLEHEMDIEETGNQALPATQVKPAANEIVVGYWDPEFYHSKIWTAICLFGVSFGALHLISWKNVFPTTVELWL